MWLSTLGSAMSFHSCHPLSFWMSKYGVQLGVKVPLWGGFSVHGGFALKLWIEKPKMDKEAWAGHLPALKRAASQANTRRKKLKMWFDNEGFLKIDDKYRKHGLTAIRLPPNSGDFNPIETVWSKLRKDFALREFEDLKHDTIIATPVQAKSCPATALLQLERSWGRVFVLRGAAEGNASKAA